MEDKTVLEKPCEQVDNIRTMNQDEREKILEKILKTDKKIRSFRFGIAVFSTAYFLAAVAFCWIYIATRRTDSIVMAVLMVFLTITSIHGYRQRLIQLREERESLDKTLGKSDGMSN